MTTGIDIDGNVLNFKICNSSYFTNRINCSDKKLISFVFIDNANEFECDKNLLTELTLPKNITKAWCHNNKFNRSLTLSKNIKFCTCDKHALDNINKYKHINQIYIDY